MQETNSISVVIPVYNSGAIIGQLIERLIPVLSQLAPAYEVILVNDGSRDNSWEQVVILTQRYSAVRGINLMRNYGQHNALLAGIRAASYNLIVTMDDDLQHPPEEIYKLLDKLNEGYDVVYGTPQHQQHGFWRDRASQITKLALQSVMGAETASKSSAFRIFRKQVRNAFTDYNSPFISIDVLLTWGTKRFSWVTVRHDPRAAGVSNYNLRKLVAHAVNMITGFSVWPLQLASFIGFSFTAFGIVVLFYVLGRYIIQGGSVPGFPFLASVIAIFSGAQLFALGIIGEYLARMHFRSMGRPSSVTRETLGFEEVIKQPQD